MSARIQLLICCVAVLAGSTSGNSMDKMLAFPGAEGFGAYSRGGRGGQVLFVTNLKDYGPKESRIPGSLRAACETKGPRTVVFRISGTITLKDSLIIREPYLTLAGQTAPGGGICLKNYGTLIKTHNVIIRHMRFRPGDEVGRRLAKDGKKWETDALGGTKCSDVIIDHCSASWANDEVLSFTRCTNITVQWCFITESLNNSTHAKGEHGYGGLVAYVENGHVTQHHNLWSYHKSRSPRPGSTKDCKGPGLLYDFRNNVVFKGGRGYSANGYDKIRMNYVGNYVQDSVAFAATPAVKIYQSENLHNKKDTGWQMIQGQYIEMDKPFTVASVQTDSAMKTYKRVLDEAGATLPTRDTVDKRIVTSIRVEKGELIGSQNQVGGWPKLKTSPPPKDIDNDGMPDTWERKHGLNPKRADNNHDRDKDGYTNIEEFLNGTNPQKRDAAN